MFRQLDYAYTSDYVTVLLDYTEDERSVRLPSIQKQMQEFHALILQSRQIYKNKRRYYQISFISKVAAFHFVKGLDFVQAPNVREIRDNQESKEIVRIPPDIIPVRAQ